MVATDVYQHPVADPPVPAQPRSITGAWPELRQQERRP